MPSESAARIELPLEEATPSNQPANQLDSIFRSGSRTYYFSSRFFPPKVRQEVTELYAFVRVADNFVDQVPADEAGFSDFCDRFWLSLDSGRPDGDLVIDRFIALYRRRGFQKEWVSAFLKAMKADLTKANYENLAEVEEYMYGSAEVVGLMMAKIMDLPDSALPAAQMLGRAMQCINFLRDIAEDLTLGRCYFPQEELRRHGLAELSFDTAKTHPKEFASFIEAQANRYLDWQKQAEAGFPYIPTRYLIPIKTASEMYKWTAHQLIRKPELIFQRKVKPSKIRILLMGGYTALRELA